MFEYATDRFVNPNKITASNIYTKDNTIRVAISLDTVNVKEAVIYSNAFQTREQAKSFIQTIPVK